MPKGVRDLQEHVTQVTVERSNTGPEPQERYPRCERAAKCSGVLSATVVKHRTGKSLQKIVLAPWPGCNRSVPHAGTRPAMAVPLLAARASLGHWGQGFGLAELGWAGCRAGQPEGCGSLRPSIPC